MNDIRMTEPISQAVAWIDETRRDHPGRSLASLLAEAGMRFNLGPGDGLFLERFFQSGGTSENHEESESP